MNTDKLMELERKWREPTPQDDCTLYTMGQRTGRIACADELAAPLRAEQAVGDEQRARELLAGEVRYAVMAEYLRNPAIRLEAFSADVQAGVRAIRRALGTARQSEGVVLISEDDRQLAIRGARSMKECADEHDGLTTEALLMYSGLLSRVAVAGRPVPDPKSLVILADAALRELGRIHEMLDDAIAKCELAKAEPTEGAVVAPIWREVEAMMVEFKAAWPADTSKSRRARANALCERFLRLRNHLRGWDGDKIESAWLAAATGRGGG